MSRCCIIVLYTCLLILPSNSFQSASPAASPASSSIISRSKTSPKTSTKHLPTLHASPPDIPSPSDDDLTIEIPLSDYTSFLSDLEIMDPTLDDLLHLQSSLQSPSFPDSDLSVSLPSFDTPESSSDRLHSILKSSTPPPNSSPGTGSLPGDCGFDPLNLYKIDFFSRRVMVDGERKKVERRPEYLIMRDYRAAEVRHGRLAMLTSILWPLQELLNKAFLPEDYTFSIVGGGVTLPWVTLGMVGGMMGLGYADVFAGVVQSEMTGEAYLGGDCFWDPLKILQGSTIEEERKMAAREVWNGRFAMMAVLFYAVQEGYTGKAVVDLEWNELFFYPIFAAKDIVPFL